jgi:hypothetical protein
MLGGALFSNPARVGFQDSFAIREDAAGLRAVAAELVEISSWNARIA